MAAMSLRPEVRALPPYRFEAHDTPIKLDQNESPEDLPAPLKEAALARLASAAWHRYPDLHPEGLARRLGARHGWPAEGVAVAGGSNVLIQALAVIAGLGRRVVTVAPSFSVYTLQARLVGAELTEVPLGAGFALPTADLEATLAHGVGVLFVAAPMAPTGNGVAVDDLERLAVAADDRWLVVIDEAYAEFAGVDHDDLARRFPQVVRLRTLSKAFGLAGARLGYALADPEVAEAIRKALLPFSVSALQVAVAETVLDAPDVMAERVSRMVAERERLLAALRTRPFVEVFPSVTNFVLFRVADAASVHEGLRDRGVLIRRQDHLPGLEGCLRVSVGLAEEVDAFLHALDAVAGESVHG